MADPIYVGSTITVRATFRGWSSNSQQSEIQDPASVVLNIFNGVGTLLLTVTPTREAYGIYSYEWTPTQADTYLWEFVGTFSTGETAVVPITIEVILPGTFAPPIASLLDDVDVEWMPILDPMFADVDSFTELFPEASQIEIAETIYLFSLEAEDVAQVTVPTVLMQEYVFAATACSLSRIYDISGGADDVELALGDLKVTRKSSIKANVTRANATTWCELAAVIRNELYRFTTKSGIKAIVKGTKVTDEMPVRQLQRAEWRSF